MVQSDDRNSILLQTRSLTVLVVPQELTLKEKYAKRSSLKFGLHDVSFRVKELGTRLRTDVTFTARAVIVPLE